MKKVITPTIWIMNGGLWLLPVAASIIFVCRGRSLWGGLPLTVLPFVITLITATCACFPNWWFRQEEDYPLIRKVFIMVLIFMYYIGATVILLLLCNDPEMVLYQKMNGIGFGLFFILLGNIMPKLRRNRLAGIRFSWTMTSDEVWRRVHYWGGIEAVIAGMVTVIVSLIFPIGKIKIMFAVIPVLILWVLVSSIHSYLIARNMKKSGE